MIKTVFENGLKLLYKHVENNLTSFSIAFEAGANTEYNEKLGIAHVVEHMVFKGTKKRNEYEINKKCDEIFGFNNAMTNYPYVVYYGTTLSADFNEGFELFSDIVLNPSFPEKGFNEEINVILEELKEWKDDLNQHCEDQMFFNGFHQRRIKELIIGNEESVKSITLDNVKSFYDKYYKSNNCVISIVSSLEYEKIYEVVNEFFGHWNDKLEVENNYIQGKDEIIYGYNKPGIYTEYKKDIQGAKVQFCFPIHNLNDKEIKMMRIFNAFFGEGTSSLLYDEVRTKNGLAYDISSSIKNEKGIKIFKISLGTSHDNIHKVIKVIKSCLEKVKVNKNYFNKENIRKLSKSLKLKRALALEKSIQQSVSLAVYEIMFRDGSQVFIKNNQNVHGKKSNNYQSPLYEQFEELESITKAEILEVINKVLVNPIIQIITVEKDVK